MEWKPVEAAAKNDKGEYVVKVNGAWIPAISAAKNDQGQYVAQFDYPQPTTTKENLGVAGNLGAGAISGAAKVGSTLLSPVDWALKKTGLQDEGYDRRARLEEFFKEHADPESMAFNIGQIGAEIAGTAGVGGAIAKPVMAAAKYVPQLTRFGQALQAGGMAKGVGAAENIAAGALTGAAGSGMVNPQDAKTGGAFGAGISAIPVAGKTLAHLVGTTSGVGGDTVKAAFNAGREGGENAAALAENMRGNVPMTDVLDQAKSALSKMRQERGAAYKASMKEMGKSPDVLPFTPIEKAVSDAMSIKSFKSVSISKSTADIQSKIADTVQEWKALDPVEYHTAEGMDALKQSIGDLRDATQFGSPERKVADSVYHAVKAQIVKADPKYSETMKDYEQASNLISEIEKSLSLGNKASADTAMRKLQSITRNNVNTNFGNRTELANKLREYGAETMMPSLSGQALSSWTPRGLQAASATGVGGMAMGYNPSMLPLVAAASPRLVGESALLSGKTARMADILRKKSPVFKKLSEKDQNLLLAAAIRQSGQGE